jgi:4-amino-4-deoxy-L-arabinose transferase-like glycosyltransferase
MSPRFETISKRAKAVPVHHWILLAILVVGIFFRTYHFRDWMTFNPDQARDALLVQDMLDGKTWPLMGPQAGNTRFSLGPIFYYFEFTSAKIFGRTADKMAYADLIFSIGAMVLFYFFLKRFFRERLSLGLTFLFSISYFVVLYSRFAFNPNSIPFFTLLFLLSLLAILDHAPREKLGWAVLLGIAMGVGFQLHAILFLALPFLALGVFGYLLFRRQFLWKSFFASLALFVLMNTGQVLSEYRTGGANMRSFFSEAGSSSGGLTENFGRDVSDDVLCHIQGYTHMITSLGSGDKCNLMKLAGRIEKKGFIASADRIAVGIFGGIFTIGGAVLFFLAWRRETDRKRKQAFSLVGAYALLIFFILLSVSSGISIRYFIVVEFMPFLFLGLWIRFLQQRASHASASRWMFAIVLLFVVSNGWTIISAVRAYRHQVAGTDNVAVLGEVERMSRYVIGHSVGVNHIYLSGKKSYLSRYGKPLEYFAKQQGIAFSKAYKTENIGAGDSFFYVMKKTVGKNALPEVVDGFQTTQATAFGNVSILQLVRKER